VRSNTDAADTGATIRSVRARRLTAAGLLLITLLAAACSSGQSKAETVFNQMVEAAEDMQSAHAGVTVDFADATGEEGTATWRGTVDYERPDRMRLTLAISAVPDAPGQTVELGVIAIGPEVYVKPPWSTEWFQTTVPGLPSVTDLTSGAHPLTAIIELDPAELGDLTLLPRETVDGVLTDHLRFTTDEQGLFGLLGAVAASGGMPSGGDAGMPEGLEADFRFDFWIGVDDHLPRRETMTGRLTPGGDSPEAGGEVSFDGVITFSRYGEDLGIRAPEAVALPSP